jgi:hypothetical protein
LVNWVSCLRPRRLGGLGIKDLDKFSRALRMKWLWHGWDHNDRPWKKMLKISDPTDRQLFFCSTVMHVGDGNNTPFWESRWLNGLSPKDVAPTLYGLTRFKQRSVNKELHNLNWIRSLPDINTSTQLEEFALLFMALEPVHLNQHKDTITWKWTASGDFSVASAYDIQFRGSFNPYPATPVWQAHAQPKCKFFVWLVMRNRILTAENMIKKGWPCFHICSFCLCSHETTKHLLVDCNYAEVVWNLIAAALSLPNYATMAAAGGLDAWVQVLSKIGSKKDRKTNIGVLCIFWWILWKERNNRIFESSVKSAQRLAGIILEEAKLQLMVYNTQ